MKNILAITLFLFSLMFSSCSEEKVKEQITPMATKCWLIESQSATNNVKYFYDSNKRIERAEGTHGSNISIQTYEFDSNNHMVKFSTLDTSGTVKNITTYEYNNHGKLSKQIYYRKQNNVLVPGSTVLYQYNTSNVLVRSDRTDNNINLGYETYTYGDQTLVIKYFDSSGNLQSTAEYEFDSMKSPTSEGGGANSGSILPPNNVLKYTSIDASGNIGVYSSTNTYQYNSQGYPTQATITYSGRPTENITFIYDCQ